MKISFHGAAQDVTGSCPWLSERYANLREKIEKPVRSDTRIT